MAAQSHGAVLIGGMRVLCGRPGGFDRGFEVRKRRKRVVLIGGLRNPQTIKGGFDRGVEVLER